MSFSSAYNMLCGRFQPFHTGHLNYLRIITAKPEQFIVGITNPDPSVIREEEGSDHRHRLDSNPFTYFERQAMIRETLRDEGVSEDRYTVTPFPVNVPELWKFYLPEHVVQHMPVFSEWEARKAQRFRDLGHEVIILDNLSKPPSATDVRERIVNRQDWKALVPPGVARVLDEILARGPRPGLTL
jgi:cytidyltransferase-like protein